MLLPFGPRAQLTGVPGLRILPLTDLPAAFADLAADAEADGVKILSVLAEDWAAQRMRFAAPGEGLFGAFGPDGMAGICGLTADPYLRDPLVGRLRRLYVLRAARRAGVGRALVDAVAGAARASGRARLRVRSPASAYLFYTRCGFVRAIGEPAATHVLPLAA